MSVIETRDLTKRYGRHTALEGLNLSVPEGTIYGFLGPNGAGKTTTIRLLLGLLRPSSGRASMLGEDCWRSGHRARQEVGYLPGDLRLYPWLTAGRAVSILSRVRGSDLRPEAERVAERFGLDMNMPCRAMSRGTRQKLGLLMALAPRPRLLILDEPSSALDPPMQDELGRCLRELAEKGHTVFLSSHTLSEVEQWCRRVTVLRQGKVVADEELSVLQKRASRAVTITFHDSPPAQPPPGLEVHERLGLEWRADYTGEPRLLLEWLSGQTLDDLVIGPPSLDTLFRSFYR